MVRLTRLSSGGEAAEEKSEGEMEKYRRVTLESSEEEEEEIAPWEEGYEERYDEEGYEEEYGEDGGEEGEEGTEVEETTEGEEAEDGRETEETKEGEGASAEEKKDMEEEEEDKEVAEIPPIEDPRVKFIHSYLSMSMKLKAEKWMKLLTTEEYKNIIMDFLEHTQIEVITFTMSGANSLAVHDNFPPTFKGKLCFFVRRDKKPVTAKNIHSILVYGDLSPNAVDVLSVWVDQVCVPLLSNPSNHKRWPLVVADDLKKHVHTIKNIVYEVRGKLHGKTLLPMPLGVEKVFQAEKDILESNGENLDIYLKCEIEGMVIKWASQINQVLNEDSASVFEIKKHPTPSDEFDFWLRRVEDLECIYDQLCDIHVRKMASILELTDSAYYPCFKTMFSNVVAALVEARDISIYLKPLQKHIDDMKSVEYDQIESYFDPVLQTLCLIWGHCRYYCSASKLTVIVREICNLLIAEGCKFLDPNLIFQSEVDEGAHQISKVIEILLAFRDGYNMYKENIALYFPEGAEPVQWIFNSEILFERTEKFLDRLHLIEDLFKTSAEYLKLEKVEIGGLKGRFLSFKIQSVFEQFTNLFEVFTNIEYDPLVPEDNSFIEDYESFQKAIEELDLKLASLFGEAFDDCHDSHSLFKFLQISGTLLERDNIKRTLNHKYKRIPTLLEQELDTVKILFDEQVNIYAEKKYIQVDRYFPPVAGLLIWLNKLRVRLNGPFETFKNIDSPIVSSANAVRIFDKYEEMTNDFDILEDLVFKHWASIVPEHCEENLKKPLVINRDTSAKLLKMNFDAKLQAVLREVRYLKLIGKEGIPETAEDLFERKNTLTQWICQLQRIVDWYNELQLSTHPVEFSLIKDELDHITSQIENMQSNLNWNSTDALTDIEEVHQLLQHLHTRTHEAQNHVFLISKLIMVWSCVPLFERKEKKKENLLQLDDREERVAKRYTEVRKAGEKILKLLKRNYHLFLDIGESEFKSAESVEEVPLKGIRSAILMSSRVNSELFEDGNDEDDETEDGDQRALDEDLSEREEAEEDDVELNEGEGRDNGEMETGKEGEEEEEREEEIIYEGRGESQSYEKEERDEQEDKEKVEREEGKGREQNGEETYLLANASELLMSTVSESLELPPTSQQLEHSSEESMISYERSGTEEKEEEDDDMIWELILERKQDYAHKWEEYTGYINEIIMTGLVGAVSCSLNFFLEETEPSTAHPLLKVSMELEDPDIVFQPSLSKQHSEGFFQLVEGLLENVLGMANLVPLVTSEKATLSVCGEMPKKKKRETKESSVPIVNFVMLRDWEMGGESEVGDFPPVRSLRSASSDDGNERTDDDEAEEETNYRKIIENHDNISEMKTEILCRVHLVMDEATKYSASFLKYSYLWLDNRDDYLQQFLEHPPEVESTEEKEEEEDEEKVVPLRSISGPSLNLFKEQIDLYGRLYEEVDKIESSHLLNHWLLVDVTPFKQALLNNVCKWENLFKQHLVDSVVNKLQDLQDLIEKADFELQKPVEEGDYDALIRVIDILYHVRETLGDTDSMFEPINDTIEMLKEYGIEFQEEIYVQLQELPEKWITTKKIAATVRHALRPLMASESAKIRKRILFFDIRQNQFRTRFRAMPLFLYECENVYARLDEVNRNLNILEEEMTDLQDQASKFEVIVPDFKSLRMCRKELRMLKILWDYVFIVRSNIDEWTMTPWKTIDADSIEMECKKYGKELRGLDKEMRVWDVFITLEATIKNLLTSLRAVIELQNPAIRDRHWMQLMEATKVQFIMGDTTTLADLLVLHLHNYEEEVKNIVDRAVKETSMEKVLKELEGTWSTMSFDYETHERTNVTILVLQEELVETLEEHQVQLQNLMNSKYIDHFLHDVSYWQHTLSTVDQVIQIWFEVQRTWTHLESIFIGSEDIRSQLPVESESFDEIDVDFRKLLGTIVKTPNVVKATSKKGLYEHLELIQDKLVRCEKALADYLDTKRTAFPRFYFVSHADLLDILSNGNQPELVCRHLPKLYDSIAQLKFTSSKAVGMFAKDGEYVVMSEPSDCTGKVEVWLNRLTDTMRKTIRYYMNECLTAYEEKPREHWILDYPAQVALVGSQIWWTSDVNVAFARLEEGYENAIKDYYRKQVSQLSVLIALLCGDMSSQTRQTIMTICTIDVHSRDVVAKLIQMKVENAQAFQWQAQLRHRWDGSMGDCFCNICDAEFQYSHEYLGNTPRLVITPLTDRCYITLTQSLHLVMGGAPAGPAGTGKTETTKDLGRAMGVMVYVFNCSEQMDYKSCGNIYKGLAQTGAWGCFDEFNRISVEVLSVVSVQVKSVLDAVKNKKEVFNFMGEYISLAPTVGMFITMNPGYAGRTELPENLKALFRPCAMVVPDFELICEIMLVAEGFQDARLLARKFITLYQLCKELLSKQDHYDWGLRAIKSVLVVAGALKRGDKQRPEDQVLMRALRDFNIPKIVSDDIPIFMGLIGDLFPSLEVPRKRDLEFEKQVKQSALDLYLQPEDNFILKVVQLEELLEVRHSVFIVGNAGSGKTMVWRSLFKTYQNQKLKPYYNDLNPKAVTNDELFGIINPATREWKDGLLSVLMREQANMSGSGPKWIVLDGDIDPMWIESLNSVMDDNKVLTLASNERISLTPVMRLLFEISHLRTATPATVSRAGILYINPQDLGWNPYVTSWVEKRTNQTEKAILVPLFDKYVPPCLETLRTKMKKITPVPEISHLEMLCHLLASVLTPANVPPDCPKDWYEIYFVFCCIWAFGSTMFQDQIVDYRVEFSKWWISEFKVVKFPPQGTVFSYYVNEKKEFALWSEKIRELELDYDIPLQAMLVDTAETARFRFFLDILVESKRPVMFVGPSGSGKSVVIADKLNCLPEEYAVTHVPFNYYTTSEMLQKVLEKPLEKRAGRNYAPKGNKLMVYSIEDMNMPEVDPYGTVQPHTLIRQYMDYGHWYDRSKLTLKDVHSIMFLATMNPSSGSFTISPRLQRHFCVFAINFPTAEPLFQIYSTILEQHLNGPHHKFPPSVKRSIYNIITASLQLHQKMVTVFLPTAVKFHYSFTLRDLANLFQVFLFTTPDSLPTESAFIRLWMHEATRVYGDKLADRSDKESFDRIINDIVRKGFEQINENEVFREPVIYCHFADGLGENKYLPIRDWKHLTDLLREAISQYNDLVAAMNLVLFEDAMSHICRINRIMESPRGNALLVGVGGSGKQSLSRLSAFISSLEVYQIQLTKGYSVTDMKEELATIYSRAGLKNIGCMFLMTDAQVPNERFLVLVNDMLASGEIADLFADDEVENVIAGMRNEVKSAGMADTRENCWKYFIEKVRRNLKIILCFSPVGSTLRIRGRKFPALVNSTCIDWFHNWPQAALESVSYQFLRDISVLPRAIRKSVSLFMAYVHTSVQNMSDLYFHNEHRFNYTTPKTFLEQISLYSKLLTEQTAELEARIVRLDNGLVKLASTEGQVDGLKEILAKQQIKVNERNKQADQLIKILSGEQQIVSMEKAIAAGEEAKVRVIEEDVSVKQKICQIDLQKAEPALIAAQAALNTLNKNNLTELKSFGAPPEAVVNVVGAVMVLFSQKGKVPKDRSWKACKVMMGKVDQFLESLVTYDKDNIHPEIVKIAKEYIKDPEFNPEKIITKSFAAAGMCAWVINIVKYNEVYEMVKPKRLALKAANAELAAAREKLLVLTTKIQELEEKLGALTKEYEEAVMQKEICQAEADRTAATIDLANRLVSGLSSEKIRWRESLNNFKTSQHKLPGDVLLITAFISYVGCFTRQYRVDLQTKFWLPYLTQLKPEIHMTEELDPLALLTDDAQIAKWNNEGLPSDRMSAENATILTHSSRWPLMIDPQLQGIKWIKTKYGNDLKIVNTGEKSYLDIIEKSVAQGYTVLIENIGESLEAVLDPLLGRNFIKKGTAIKIGDKEVDFNPKFRLILHTKLANPHYKPEMQAQTTLINFTVTRDGLEEQLLAEVVKAERPDLEMLKSQLTKQQNNFKITLKELEDDLLLRLATAGEDILSDVELVENLERTKRTAAEIEEKVKEAKVTGEALDEAREAYRMAATRGSLLYFVLNDLNKINPIYQFSLKAFSVVFMRAITSAAGGGEDVAQKVNQLLDSITYSVFMYTSRGLFEKDKRIFLAQMTIQILLQAEEIDPIHLDFLLRFPIAPNATSPVEFLSNELWGAIKVLSLIDEFRNLDRDIESSAKRWKAFIDSPCPELEKFPQEWKTKVSMERLCIMRCLRPDRMTYATAIFVEEKLGSKYVRSPTPEFIESYREMNKATPVFFILSPGVDPLTEVEKLGKRLGYTTDRGNFHNVSLGQGQEPVAEEAMTKSAQRGHWVILQNIHLVKNWLPTLEHKMVQCQESAHKKFRLFMSAEPAPDSSAHVIPQGILESSIKITNEPPTGMQANIHKAFDNFSQDVLEVCSKESEFKAILFSLCYFHAVVAERRKFGPQGWNRSYPFNFGDLTICVNVLYNYLESNSKIPWEDLRYLFGEIMYGGHITDDWDRHLCRTYLAEYMKPELIEGDLFFAPGFLAPPNLDYPGYHKYIDENLPPESPSLYGLHPNAEIGVLTTLCQALFQTVLELQPREAGATGGSAITKEEKIKQVLEEIADKIPDEFRVAEMMGRVEDRSPYTLVAFQECERMNSLMTTMKRSLKELELGQKGELTISTEMELLMDDLFIDKVPKSWQERAYPSMLSLGPWFADFLLRLRELEGWTSDFMLPPSVWLSGFFNPQSFLTAIMQSTARKNDWPLDRMCLLCDVTKKMKDEITSAPREGANVHGLFMEGAQWDSRTGGIIDAKMKELYPMMPVIYIKAVTQDKQDVRNIYECPVYKTRLRGPTYVWTFNLKSKQRPAKWTLAGVALLLQV